jgi:hypothetical protein
MSQTMEKNPITILVTREGMGNGDLQLQQKLLTSYLRLLDEHNTLPNAICFYTEVVKLVVEGSPVLEVLSGGWPISSKRNGKQRR